MKEILVVSFDLISPAEPPVSLSIASLIGLSKSSLENGKTFQIHHRSFNLVEHPNLSVDAVMTSVMSEYDLASLDIIAISCYIWSEYLVNPLIASLRREGYTGSILLGGHQIQYSDSLQLEYPDCQIFIKGYGENSFLRVATANSLDIPQILSDEPDFASIPSSYLTGLIPVEQNQSKVRMETKRGCPYRCGFCSHRDLQRNRVYAFPRLKTIDELTFFKARSVRKVNVIDPVYNIGPDYLWILEQVIEMDAKFLISLQTRFELIRDKRGAKFLDLCSKLNVCLEFGLQSIIAEECAAINRFNNLPHISNVLKTLNDKGIQYEVSLIYGLPLQTLKSFEKSIQYLRENGCANIKAFPLKLLKGTELWARRGRWGLVEKAIGPYHIPLVVKSSSFDEHEWRQMQKIAESLKAERGVD